MMTATLWCTRFLALFAMVSRNRCLIYSRYFRENIMIKASNTIKLFTSALLIVIPMLLADSQAAKAQPDSFGIRIAKIPNYKGSVGRYATRVTKIRTPSPPILTSIPSN